MLFDVVPDVTGATGGNSSDFVGKAPLGAERQRLSLPLKWVGDGLRRWRKYGDEHGRRFRIRRETASVPVAIRTIRETESGVRSVGGRISCQT